MVALGVSVFVSNIVIDCHSQKKKRNQEEKGKEGRERRGREGERGKRNQSELFIQRGLFISSCHISKSGPCQMKRFPRPCNPPPLHTCGGVLHFHFGYLIYILNAHRFGGLM